MEDKKPERKDVIGDFDIETTGIRSEMSEEEIEKCLKEHEEHLKELYEKNSKEGEKND